MFENTYRRCFHGRIAACAASRSEKPVLIRAAHGQTSMTQSEPVRRFRNVEAVGSLSFVNMVLGRGFQQTAGKLSMTQRRAETGDANGNNAGKKIRTMKDAFSTKDRSLSAQ